MEILSNIWSILTTENEMMTKIIISPAVIIEDLISFLLITSILQLQYSKKHKIIYVLSLSVVSLTTNFFIPSPYNIFINYFLTFIIVKKVFNLNIINSIICIIIPTAVYALIGLLLLKPVLLFFNINVEQITIIPIYRFSYLIVLYLTTFCLTKFIIYSKLNIKLIESFDKKNKKIIILNVIFGIFTICIQLVVTSFYTDILPAIITFLSFISLLAYFIISFYSLNRTMKLQVTAENLETAEKYNETLTYLYDNVKAFKHDFDNMVFVLGGFIESNDINKLKKYYKNLEKDCERVNNIALLNPKLINNSGVYNLLMSKYKKASEYNVEIKLEYFFDLEKLNMPIYEFSRILGILLDNALEAAKDSKEKQIHILFRDSHRNNTQIISIENAYSNKDVDTSAIFEKGKTSKENHTGMGLWEVKQILNRNNNVNLITTKNEKYFKQSIEIYY